LAFLALRVLETIYGHSRIIAVLWRKMCPYRAGIFINKFCYKTKENEYYYTDTSMRVGRTLAITNQ
jgi:hypothetical protein